MKLLYSTMLTMLVSLISNAQISTGYSMGIVDGNSFSEATFSYPVTVNYDDCYFVTNTLLKYWAGNDGSFVSSCNSVLEKELVFADTKYLDFPVQIYPNPTSAITEIIFLSDLNFLKSFDVNIFSSNGSLVLIKENIPFNEFKIGYKLNISLLSNGIYYLSLTSEDFYKSFKIIKI
ncbi:hypothetical protein BST83_02060 [Polaribacter filamentus]|jgi:hypothetical protein|uniref:Secretion system C-terminal sorting domain-containing protein n=1 Tax=Polaribacter filamentus TaxID=53483 RepID=A0A2S7KTY6_9FLAO|nr:T9SS type A sorting domain-containing protein [Polaribacter filamentus]PQB06099.1 hypothetical protein BST83_02060 [Polaribacter filamentus]